MWQLAKVLTLDGGLRGDDSSRHTHLPSAIGDHNRLRAGKFIWAKVGRPELVRHRDDHTLTIMRALTVNVIDGLTLMAICSCVVELCDAFEERVDFLTRSDWEEGRLLPDPTCPDNKTSVM